VKPGLAVVRRQNGLMVKTALNSQFNARFTRYY
jgi:hypothetical protein